VDFDAIVWWPMRVTDLIDAAAPGNATSPSHGPVGLVPKLPIPRKAQGKTLNELTRRCSVAALETDGKTPSHLANHRPAVFQRPLVTCRIHQEFHHIAPFRYSAVGDGTSQASLHSKCYRGRFPFRRKVILLE